MFQRPQTVVVVVEGASDKVALETLAARLGVALEHRGVTVVPIGGAQAIRRYVERRGPEVRLAGLCDAGEERHFRRALERAGYGTRLTRPELERLGFFVCVDDLEDELIRALGTDAVQEVVDAQGELGSFRTFQKQPAQRERPPAAQLRRFLGTHSGRKSRYARVLVEALELARAPHPLAGLLAFVTDAST
jgi:hypothetical protein